MSRGVKWILTNVITHFKMQSLEHSETLIWCKLDIKTGPTVSWFEGKSILHLLPNFFLNLFKTMYIKGKISWKHGPHRQLVWSC